MTGASADWEAGAAPLGASFDGTFDDVLAANEEYAREFPLGRLHARAARGLAVVTCIDSRIEPLAILGLRPGDAKILRNAGARVTDDVLRTLVPAAYLLGVERVMVVGHTDCAMAQGSDDDLRAAVRKAGGPDMSGFEFLASVDQETTIRADVERIRSSDYLAPHPTLRVGGFLYDVHSGRLAQVC